jgi:acyl CoA:acetate/3-ketoacid CoA transferase beta subunit
VITDLGLLRPRPGSLELELTHLHPGVTVDQARAATGWELKVSPLISHTEPPRPQELTALRNLSATLTAPA